MKKLAVIGRGLVGCLAVGHFLRWTNWHIDWIYDPTLESNPVGEGTNLKVPYALYESLAFNWNDIQQLDATPKIGILKNNWGTQDYLHPFPSNSVALHINAISLQNYIFNKLQTNNRITYVESNVADANAIDADYVMVCTGSPNEFEQNFEIISSIPVNTCLVSQCPWYMPRFNYSLTHAQKHGWTFGIPLTNRCSIGYLYDQTLVDESEIRDQVKNILAGLDLEPSMQRIIRFRNYRRKQNFQDRICYNGNASFFLEPLEATSTGTATDILRCAYDLWLGTSSLEQVNAAYTQELDHIEAMICLHYMSGSRFQSKFWDGAESRGTKKVAGMLNSNQEFYDIIKLALESKNPHQRTLREVGSWTLNSYKINIQGLGLADKLKALV